MADYIEIRNFTTGNWSNVCRGEMQCTYCSHPYKHEVVTIRTKRIPPTGGKDLGIFDEHTREQFTCTGCGGVSETSSFFKPCDQCGTRTVLLHVATSATGFSACLCTYNFHWPGEQYNPPVYKSKYKCISHLRCSLRNLSLDEKGISVLVQTEKNMMMKLPYSPTFILTVLQR